MRALKAQTFVPNKRGGFHMALIKATPTKWVMLAQQEQETPSQNSLWGLQSDHWVPACSAGETVAHWHTNTSEV